jgi:urease accessory protein
MTRSIVACAVLGLATASITPTIAFAHPGFGPHGGLAAGFMHPLTGVDHILAMVAVGMFAANLGRRALWAVPLTFMALMTIGGALGMAGVKLPFPEMIIALSVIVLGLAIAFPRRWPVPAAMLLVGGFAIFHGHAHGTEISDSLSRIQFTAGFIVATALLHLTGIALGIALLRVDTNLGRSLRQMSGIGITLIGISLFGLAV